MWYIGRDEGNVYIAHHGIMGQKWGIRRYQNKDGTLTPEGLKRYQRFDSKSYKAEKRSKYEDEGMSSGKARKLAKIDTKLAKRRDKIMYKAQKKQQKVESKYDKEEEKLSKKLKKINDTAKTGEKRDELTRKADAKATKNVNKLMAKWRAQQGKLKTNENLNENADDVARAYQDMARHANRGAGIGWFIGGIPGALIGSSIGKKNHEASMGENSWEGQQRKARPDSKQIKQEGKDRYLDLMKSKGTKTNAMKENNAAIDNAVKQAKKTGLYDMEFLERNLDIDDRTGEPLTGEALDNAYRKYLKKQGAR